MNVRAKQRQANGDTGDDRYGTIAIILAYVDDTNLLLHHDDVKYFLDRFKELGEKLGAVLNTEKTRILTSTNNESTVQKLLTSSTLRHAMTGTLLQQAIQQYSTDKDKSPVEVTDGLRVLGSPIGSHNYCKTFLSDAMQKATSDAHKLLNNLDDLQTITRIYSQCTVHKMTHLFGCDVYNSSLDDLPNKYYLWESDLTSQFSDMTNHVLSSITNKNELPTHSHIIANMAIKQGGLGLQHPRTNAISAYMSTTKRCLQYAHQGVWLGFNKNRPILPDSIRCLYLDWETSNDRTWKIFRKYMHDFTSICCSQAHSHLDYVFNTSINKSRETIKEHAAIKMRKEVLEDENITPFEIRKVLPGILDRRTSMALMTMSRLEERQRIKNNIFTIALKRKLRLKLFDNGQHHICKCTKPIDDYGDHFLGCTVCHKTTASNGIRDGIIHVFQRVLPVAKMIKSTTQVECETHNIVPSLPRLKPFDLSIRLDHSLDPGAWRVPFSRIGFDVVMIHSTQPSKSTPSEAATYNETDLRLRVGERKKFERNRGGTNILTKRTLTPDEVIGEILDSNYSFIPIAIGPHCEIGSLFNRFLYGGHTLPLPNFNKNRPNAERAAQRCISTATPWGILDKADKQWKHLHGDKLFGANYLTPLPSSWADQQLGLTFITHISNHIFSSYKHIKHSTSSPPPPDSSLNDDDSSYYDDENEWKYHDGDILGEEWLADEYFGIDTCDVIDVEGVGNSLPAIRTCDVVLEPS